MGTRLVLPREGTWAGSGLGDWELLVELGHSFYPAPVYVMGWAGYRWRETNEAIARKPGDERLIHGAVGGGCRCLHLEGGR